MFQSILQAVSEYVSSSGHKFQYRPLDASKHEIRIAIIQPGSLFSQIHCHLLHVSLEDYPRYEALSYAWGDSNIKHRILLSGCDFEINTNLHTALHQLRFSNEPRAVWIDALCINQTEISERNEQVQQMREIYRGAVRTIVWLGPPSHDSTLAINFLRETAEYEGGDDDSEWLLALADDQQNLPKWKALDRLLDREYWRRMWIIQEITSSSDIVVYCGNDSIEWTQLCRLLDVMIDSPRWVHKIRNKDAIIPVLMLYEKMIPPLLDQRRCHRDEKLWPLWLHLNFARESLASDPRDHVLALLGIADFKGSEGAASRSIIDYSKTTCEIYVEATKLLMYKDERLQNGPLSIICMSQPHRSDRGLPTWVRDWSLPSDSHSLQDMYPLPLDEPGACGRFVSDVKIEFEDQILICEGVVIDIIDIQTKANEVPAFTSIDIAERATRDFCAVLHSWSQVAMSIDNNMPHFSKSREMRVHEFSRTVNCNRSFPSKTLLVQFPEMYEEYLRREEHFNILEIQDIEPFLASTLGLSGQRQFCVSSTGMFLVAPPTACRKDLICVLNGCDFPVILRKVEDHYIFIGESYVHGYMEGLAMEELAAGKLELQEFRIH